MRKSFRYWPTITALGLLLSLLHGLAQTAESTVPTREGQVVAPEPTRYSPEREYNFTSPMGSAVPPNNDITPLPSAVSIRIQSFKQSARTYLERQEAIKKQLKGTTDEERARIREQLRIERQQLLNNARENLRNLQPRKEELRGKLGSHGDLIGNKQDAKSQLQEKKNEARERIAIDK